MTIGTPLLNDEKAMGIKQVSFYRKAHSFEIASNLRFIIDNEVIVNLRSIAK